MTVHRVVILGAGGYGRLVHDTLFRDATMYVAGFLDPDPTLHGTLVNAIRVLGGDGLLGGLRDAGVDAAIVAVGNNQLRAKLFRRVIELGYDPVNAIHPTACIGRHVQMGRGVVILAGAVVNVNARIGDNVVINTAATVDHDTVLEDHSQIWPGANLAGNVRVGSYAYVGTGAAVIPGVVIGANTVIGAGAAVVSNIPDNVVAVGVPARVIKERPLVSAV